MSYSNITDHHSMVFDGARNRAYTRALAEVITPGATVMDLGAGLGVLGLSAASLGAGAVHLVEPELIVGIAKKVAGASGLANVHCHSCSVEELQLDSKVDVMLSVFTGNFLLTEDLLPSLFYARDHFLAPGGQMIPHRARMEVVPVSVPEYYREHIEAWRQYSRHARENGLPVLDYEAVRHYAANTIHYADREVFNPRPLAAPAELMELDFMTATSAACDAQAEVELTRAGTCHGWLGWFQMRLGSEWFSTSGEEQLTHWSPVFLPLEQPLELEAGARIGFNLKRPEFGEWSWETQYKGSRQLQSTFLSQPISMEKIARRSENYHPRVSAKGEAARWLLAHMTGESTTIQLAVELRGTFPDLFVRDVDALTFTQHLAEHYS